MIGNCPECGEDYLNAKTIEDGKTYCWTRARCQCGHVFMFRVDPPGILEIAQYGNSVKEEERMNQLFCETTEELFCEITENLELTQKNKELFRIFLHSLDTEEMRIFILNRLFVRRIAQNETSPEKGV